MATACGTPCWVSLMTRDMEAAERFYGSVLDWDFRPGSFGPGFRVALDDGLAVAGLSELATSWQMPVSWSAYFRVDDADLAASRIRERGATMGVGPLRLGEGRAALAADPSGAAFGLWEGDTLPHWEVGSGRAPAWLELRTRDAFAAAVFYGEVFEWADATGRCEVAYQYETNEVFVRAGGHTVAGLRGGGVEAAPDPSVRPRWQVYFRVPDAERAAKAALAAGGTVLAEPAPMSLGVAATLRDPDGALFSVLAA
ncbi:VOC family protein [Streptomyces sp. NPDC054796]